MSQSSASAAGRADGQLGTADVIASTVANIGPGIDFYFAFGVIALTAGVAAPLTILAAGVAVTFLAYTVAQFTKAEPSAGSFITYVETSLGARAGVLTALLVAVGYTVAIAGVFTMSGGMLALTIAHYTSLTPPWEPISLLLTVAAVWLTIRGVKLSTSAVGVAVLVQVAIMLITCVTVLIDRRTHLSAIPFSWSHLTGGIGGLSAGFPLALYMFIGWENGPALAEECRNPRRSIPRALYASIAIATFLFVLFAYATVTGFHYNVSSIGRSSVPFLTVADHYLGGAAPLAWAAGVISVLATLIAAANSQARMLYDGGRSRLLPSALGRARTGENTPVTALLTMGGAGLAIIAVWWVAHATGLVHGSTDPSRPLRRVLDDGHDRDPVRLPAHLLRATRVHLAPPAPPVLSAAAPSSTGSGSGSADHPLHRAVQARTAGALQLLSLSRAPAHSDRGRRRAHRGSTSPGHRSRGGSCLQCALSRC